MIWANFLHIYQPPTQTKRILDRVVNESYRRILVELKNAPQAKLTLNITAGLTELLDQYGFTDVIEDIGKLLEKGQLELTASAKYHPLLPKLPDDEIIRQIKADVSTNRGYFGEAYQPRGFFPPEAAYDRRLAKIVAQLGFEWILAEELSYKGDFGSVKYDRMYGVESTPLKIFFRERESSFKILSGQLGTVKLFEDYLGPRLARNEYLLTAMDGETFGHHRPGMEKLLFEIFKSPNVRTVTISQLPKLFPKTEIVKTRPSTWALMEKDIEKNEPFSRWDDPGNEIHRLQWELTNLAIRSVKNSNLKTQISKLNLKTQNLRKEDLRFKGLDLKFDICDLRLSGRNELTSEQRQWLKARQLLDKSLHSDQYWWASARPWWSIEMIERGANELAGVVQVTPDAPKEVKKRAQDLYYQILTQAFEWQRSGKVEEISRREDEEMRERADSTLPKLPPAEIDKMIENIRDEMLQVAEKQEYERATQLRDRIRELEEYKGDRS